MTLGILVYVKNHIVYLEQGNISVTLVIARSQTSYKVLSLIANKYSINRYIASAR